MATQKLKLEFPLQKVGVPVFSKLATTFDVEPNVLAADINPGKGGWLVISVSGEEARIGEALNWITENGITVTNVA
jgi:ABC-type methionine transport system ATPase subunit